MTTETLIAVGGILLSVLIYFAGVQRTEGKLLKKERSTRIKNVFDDYMNFRRSNETDGLDGLKRAGTATLYTDEEIVELINMIMKYDQANPLGCHRESLTKVSLKKFFDVIANREVNLFDDQSVKGIIAKM